MHCTQPRCQHWDLRPGKICGFSDYYPLTLLLGGVNHIKESVQLCTGRSKLLKELKFRNDKYQWKRVQMGYFLVSLCLLSFLQSLLTISQFLFSLTTFFHPSCCPPCPYSSHDIFSCIYLYGIVPFHELTNSIGLSGHIDVY